MIPIDNGKRHTDVGAVVIGRNEGVRLAGCLASLPGGLPVVYVDSGSVDGSAARVSALGIDVLELDSALPFSAARARNEGLARLAERYSGLRFVQMIDGDCLLDEDWLPAGVTFLEEHERAAVVTGRCREAHPERSIYNAWCDIEWRTPVGEIESCGGNALMRIAALQRAGGYDSSLVAGEEPDLCHRLRLEGWTVYALAQDMVRHDAAMNRFGQWAKRTVRSGFAYAQLVERHRTDGSKSWRRSLISIALWAALLPLAVVAVAVLLSRNLFEVIGLSAVTVAVLYLFQALRIARRIEGHRHIAASYGISLMLGKPLQLWGALLFAYRQLSRTYQPVMDYKDPSV